MRFSRRWIAVTVVAVAGVAGAFVIVPDPPEVVVVGPEPGAAAYTSIQAAVDSLGPRGGTVEVQEGRYPERVVLDGRRNISLQARSGDLVVLDASELTPPSGLSGVLEVRGGGLIQVVGLELTGYRSTVPGAVPSGFLATGGVDDLTVSELVVHDIGASVDDPSVAQADAHGIAVYGDDPLDATTDLIISDSEVYDLTLGASEAVVVNGNVDGWEILDNSIHDIDNVGIDAIGWEETIAGDLRFGPTNRARSGVISGNQVSDVSAGTNPAYGPDGCVCAGGIYLDGSLGVDVRDNTVERADIGIEVGAEHPDGGTEGIDVVANTVVDARLAAIAVGAAERDQGPVSRVLVRGNVLHGEQTDSLVLLQHDLSDVRVSSNELTLAEPGGALVQVDGQGAVVLDHNQYVAPEPRFVLRGREFSELRAWQLDTRQDPNSALRIPGGVAPTP